MRATPGDLESMSIVGGTDCKTFVEASTDSLSSDLSISVRDIVANDTMRGERGIVRGVVAADAKVRFC